MKKTVLAFGLDLPDVDGFEANDLASDRSFLDGDIIVVEFSLGEFHNQRGSNHNGLPKLTSESSFNFLQTKQRWQANIDLALAAGKTVVVFLRSNDQRYCLTGTSESSGTGKNTRVVTHVALCSNYDFLPVKLSGATFGRGSGMKLVAHKPLLANFWSLFSNNLQYNVHFDETVGEPLVRTRSGDKVVACLRRGPTANGGLILLPELVWDDDLLATYAPTSNEAADAEGDDSEEEEDDDEETLTRFTLCLRDALIALDAGLQGAEPAASVPPWAEESNFRLNEEADLEAAVVAIGDDIRTLEQEKSRLLVQLRSLSTIRFLLHGKGHELEDAVRDALRGLGFTVDRFEAGGSEFDVVFEGDGRRFLGEIEGKDSKSIGIDKASQLQRNLAEDFDRDDVGEMAMGVLFGNANRLAHPEERAECFTTKVLAFARVVQIALVDTTELFRVALSLRNCWDEAFASRCREAIADGAGGLVAFPSR